MKRKSIWVVAAVLLLVVTTTTMLLLYDREPPEINRKKYPYANSGTSSDVSSGSEIYIAEDMRFEFSVSHTNDYVVGTFVTGVDNTKTTTSVIRPKEGTTSDLQYKSWAKADGKSYEEELPAWTYYEFQFKVTEDYGGGNFKAGETIPVKVVIPGTYRGEEPYFPSIEAGIKAVMGIWISFDSDQYVTDPQGFFYIDKYDRVISCYSHPDFDMYTGRNINDFAVILQETFNSVKHIGTTGSRLDTSITTEPDTSAATEPDTTDVKVSEPASETDTAASDSSMGEDGTA